MIVLVGGTSCTGKTKLAHDLMVKYGIPYISIDILMMGIYRSNKNCGFTPMSKREVISDKLWPILYEMIKTNIENSSHCIYEGFQLLPKNVAAIEDRYQEDIRSYFLCFNEKSLINNYYIIKDYRKAIEQRNDVDDLELSIKNNREILAECKLYHQPVFRLKDNYIEEERRIIDIIGSEIKQYL